MPVAEIKPPQQVSASSVDSPVPFEGYAAMRRWTRWLPLCSLAVACGVGVGCGNSDVPDPSSDRNAASDAVPVGGAAPPPAPAAEVAVAPPAAPERPVAPAGEQPAPPAAVAQAPMPAAAQAEA